ncbi:hypothetical protein Droror1_Dr00022369 [Drosera rotundifolia]
MKVHHTYDSQLICCTPNRYMSLLKMTFVHLSSLTTERRHFPTTISSTMFLKQEQTPGYGNSDDVVTSCRSTPERWLPGKFDIAGQSHQLFYVLVVTGAYTHYRAGLVYLKWRDLEGCLLEQMLKK